MDLTVFSSTWDLFTKEPLNYKAPNFKDDDDQESTSPFSDSEEESPFGFGSPLVKFKGTKANYKSDNASIKKKMHKNGFVHVPEETNAIETIKDCPQVLSRMKVGRGRGGRGGHGRGGRGGRGRGGGRGGRGGYYSRPSSGYIAGSRGGYGGGYYSRPSSGYIAGSRGGYGGGYYSRPSYGYIAGSRSGYGGGYYSRPSSGFVAASRGGYGGGYYSRPSSDYVAGYSRWRLQQQQQQGKYGGSSYGRRY